MIVLTIPSCAIRSHAYLILDLCLWIETRTNRFFCIGLVEPDPLLQSNSNNNMVNFLNICIYQKENRLGSTYILVHIASSWKYDSYTVNIHTHMHVYV